MLTLTALLLAAASQAVAAITGFVGVDATGIQYAGAWSPVQFPVPLSCDLSNNLSAVRTLNLTSGFANVTYTFQGSGVAPVFVSTDGASPLCSGTLHVDPVVGQEIGVIYIQQLTNPDSPKCTHSMAASGLDPAVQRTATLQLDGTAGCVAVFAGFLVSSAGGLAASRLLVVGGSTIVSVLLML